LTSSPSYISISSISETILTSYSDIIKGLTGSDSPTISSFIKGLPHDLLDELENNEQQAGQFVCQILDGNIPGVIENLGEDIWREIEDDWSAVTSFIAALPSLAPEVLEDIVHDGEDVVSVIGEIFTDPEAALTVIENGVEVVVSDIESVGGDVVSFFKCLFGDCSTSTPPDPAATLSASCQAIQAAATTTYSPTVAATTTYPAAQTSYYEPPPTATTTTEEIAAETTSTEVQAAATTIQAAVTSTKVDIYTDSACWSVDYALSWCASASPGFLTIDTTLQAPCLCYSEVNPTSTDWRPDIFDGNVLTCSEYMSAVVPASLTDIADLEDFCTEAGDVLQAETTSTPPAAAGTTTGSTNNNDGAARVTTSPNGLRTQTSQQLQSSTTSSATNQQGSSGVETFRPQVSHAWFGILVFFIMAVILL
jgi:hypothetical protein